MRFWPVVIRVIKREFITSLYHVFPAVGQINRNFQQNHALAAEGGLRFWPSFGLTLTRSRNLEQRLLYCAKPQVAASYS
jgi:hypothetical protein